MTISWQAHISSCLSASVAIFHHAPPAGDVGAYGECAATYAFSPDFFVLPKLTLLLFSFCVSALQTVFVLVFLVIVPLCNPAGNLWNLIIEAATELGGDYARRSTLNNLMQPLILLVSGLALSVSKQIADITLLSSSHQTKQSAYLLCVLWWSA